MSTAASTAVTNNAETEQAERDRVGAALREYADRKRPNHEALIKARAEAVVMALGYAELHYNGELVLVSEGVYSYEDVLGWLARAIEAGAAMPQLGGRTIDALFRAELVPNAVFRETLERRIAAGTASMKGLAADVPFVDGDDRNLERALGMETSPGTKGYPPTLRLFVSYDQAVELMTALKLDPHDCGV